MVDFDYVVVDAGTAGCVLASRPGRGVAARPGRGNTQAPAMAVAWIAADLIFEDS
jgi:hypothetical protein